MSLSNEDYAKLLESLKTGNAKLETVLERYYASGNDDALRNLARQDVIAICDSILNAGDWNHSPFLRQVISPVVETKQSMLDALSEDNNSSEEVEAVVYSQDMQEIFIAVYQADGHNIGQWAVVLRSLPSFVLGRPIYENEDNAISFIRSKEDRYKEAYVKVMVSKKAIMDDMGAVRCDRIGQQLLSINQGALLVENIVSFHHLGAKYKFNGKDLVKV